MANNPSSLDTRPERETRRREREIYVRMDPDIIRAADAAERIIAHWQSTIRNSTRTN